MRSVVDESKLSANALHYSFLTFNIEEHCELNFCLNLCLYSHNPKLSLLFSEKCLSNNEYILVSLFGRYCGKMS